MQYFYHHNMKLRSIKELRFYVKYGFMPCRSQGKRTIEILQVSWTSYIPSSNNFLYNIIILSDLQEGPSINKRVSYLDGKEDYIITKFNIDTDIACKVDQCIKEQLHWTKEGGKLVLTNGNIYIFVYLYICLILVLYRISIWWVWHVKLNSSVSNIC